MFLLDSICEHFSFYSSIFVSTFLNSLCVCWAIRLCSSCCCHCYFLTIFYDCLARDTFSITALEISRISKTWKTGEISKASLEWILAKKVIIFHKISQHVIKKSHWVKLRKKISFIHEVKMIKFKLIFIIILFSSIGVTKNLISFWDFFELLLSSLFVQSATILISLQDGIWVLVSCRPF